MTRTLLGWLAAILVASGSEAQADRPEPLPAAKPHVEAGVAAYSAGNYELAIREFQAAYAIDPHPTVLYAWAQSMRLGKRCEDALVLYRRYLATNPSEAQVAAAQNGISRCEQAQPTEPAAPAVSPAPARPGPGPSTDDPQPRRWYTDPLGGALVISGVVSLGAGVGLLVRSSQNRDAARDATIRDDFVELIDTATLQRRLGAVGLGLGAALTTGGIIRYATRRDRPRAAIALTGRALVVVGRF